MGISTTSSGGGMFTVAVTYCPARIRLPGVLDIPLDDRRVLIGVDHVADLVDRSGKSRGRCRAHRSHGPPPFAAVEGLQGRQCILGAVGDDQQPAHVGDLKQVDRVVDHHLVLVDVAFDDDAVRVGARKVTRPQGFSVSL